MKKGIKLFFSLEVLLLLILVGMITMSFRFTGFIFLIQFTLLSIVFVGSIVSMLLIYNEVKLGYFLMSLLLSLALIDLLFIYFKSGPLNIVYFVTIVSAAIGFVLSVVMIEDDQSGDEGFKDFPGMDEIEKPVEKEFSPGKFLASSTSTYYHTPKCEWAKKIKKSNQVWINSEEEAKKKKLKKHNCLK